MLSEQAPWWREFRTANGMNLGGGDPDPEPGGASLSLARLARRDHMGNFFDAIRDDAPLACNVDLGCATMVAIRMGVDAWKQDQVLRWDAVREMAIPT